MKTYRVTRPTFLYSGLIKLDPETAENRLWRLKPVDGEGMYEIVGELSFKRGEIIGLPDVPKGLMGNYEIVTDEEKPEEPRKPGRRAKRKA